MPFLNVGGIAAEQLVRTLAGEDDLYILPGVFRQEIEGDFGGVGEGFVHEILDLCGGAEIVVGGNFVGDVGNADNFGEVLGVGKLAVLFFLIAYGEGLHVFGDLGDLLHHIAGVHAAGQEAAHFHVADLMGFHGFGEFVGDEGFPLFQRFGVVDVIPDVVVFLDVQFAVFIGEALTA